MITLKVTDEEFDLIVNALDQYSNDWDEQALDYDQNYPDDAAVWRHHAALAQKLFDRFTEG